MITKQEFDNLYVEEELVVRCMTEESIKEFMKLADEFGYKWIDDTKYTEGDNWQKWGKDYAYCLNSGTAMDLSYWKCQGRKIVKYELGGLNGK